MKYTDFYWFKHVNHYSQESLFYNKSFLESLLRTVNYFEKGFLNSPNANKLQQLDFSGSKNLDQLLRTQKLSDLFDRVILRRCESMADYIYDESAFILREHKGKKEINHEENIKNINCNISNAVGNILYISNSD